MPIKKRVVLAGLMAKGFVKKNKSHVVMSYFLERDSKPSVITHLSHKASGKDVNDLEISLMAGQCKLTNQQFINLVECTLSKDEYEKILIGKRKERTP